MQSRGVLRLLVARDLKVRYADSFLGYLWTILDPLALALVYWFVFGVIFQARGSIGAQPYILFLIVGLLPWNWAFGSITDATKALTAEAKIVRSSSLPRELWVMRVVASKWVEFVLALPVVVLFMAIFRVGLSWYALAIPLAMLIQAVFLLGVALILAPATVLVNDLQRVVRIWLRVYFYLTPVIYGITNVPAAVRPFFSLNPLTGVLELYRAALFPSEFGGWGQVGIAAGMSLLVLVIGIVVFRRLERPVLKEI